MRINLTNNAVYQLLFFVAVVFSYVNNYELSLAVWLLIMGVTVKRHYSKAIIFFILFFVIVLVLGVFRAFFFQHELYNIFRDISYFIKPIVGLLIGYQCFRDPKVNFFKTVINISLAIAIAHLLILTYAFLFESVRTVHEVRSFGGYFSDFETFALIVLIFKNKFNLRISNKNYYLLLVVIGVSVFFYFARTNLIQFVLIATGMFGLFKLTKNRVLALSVLILLGIFAYQKVVDMNPIRNAEGIEGFLYKIKNAPNEIYDPYVVNDNTSRFHDNFRSYETKVTILQVLNEGNLSLIFGKGFGATVNYGSLMHTNDGTEVRHAPILHNGYTTVFLKTGVLGLLIYLIGSVYLCRLGKKTDNYHTNNIKLLINSSGVFMFISTLVFLGFYLKLDNKSLFIGGLISYYELRKLALRNGN